MHDLVVCDAGPLIALGRLQQLCLLPQLAGRVIAPQSVIAEATADAIKPGATAVLDALQRGWLLAHPDPVLLPGAVQALDAGEACAITLALEWKATVLVDERKGRAVAQRLGLACTGTVGLLVQARQRQLLPALAPLLRQLQGYGYFLNPALLDDLLVLVGEKP